MTFDDFWSVYPRKVCKKPAEKAWNAAIKREKPEVIISAARRYAESRKGKDPEFTCHARTWLSQDRWEDFSAPQAKQAETTSNDQWYATWIITHGYAPWISESAVRRAIAIGILNKEAAEKAGYRV